MEWFSAYIVQRKRLKETLELKRIAFMNQRHYFKNETKND